MSDNNLRNKIIRLAKENPELRSDLLPLLKKEAAKPFDLKKYKDGVWKELNQWIKMNEKQRKQWKEAYTHLLTLYNITFVKEQKERIEVMLRDLKGDILRTLNTEKENLEHDLMFFARLEANNPESARYEIEAGMKAKRAKNSALYHLKEYR